MGNMLSTSSNKKVADGITYLSRRDEEKYADIKLSCDSFMKFDGTLEFICRGKLFGTHKMVGQKWILFLAGILAPSRSSIKA